MAISMSKLRRIAKDRRKPLLWTIAVVCLYALLGFLFVPWLAERKLVELLQQRLALNASVEAIHFNPFTFTASIDLLDVQTADNTPVLSLQRLYLNVDPMRLFLLKIRVAEILVDTLQLHYNRYSAGDDTISRLAQQWQATAPADEAGEAANPPDAVATNGEDKDDELIRLQIGRVQYINGSIHYRDEVPATDFATTLGPLNIDIADISTLDTEEQGMKDLVLQIEQDATLRWNSSFDINPLQFSGRLALDNFSLTTPYRYFQDTLPFVLRDGRLALAFDYAFSLDDASGPRLEISNGSIEVSTLDAIEVGADTAFLERGTLKLEGASFQYPAMTTRASALRIDGLNLAVLRDAQGRLNLQNMLDNLNTNAEPAPADDAATPLQLSLDEFSLSNSTVKFTDQSTGTPATLGVQAQASLRSFTLDEGASLPFDARLTFESGGTLAAEGTLQLFPAVDVDAMLDLQGLALPVVQPYFDEFAQVTLQEGQLGFAARLRSNASETLSWTGDLTLDNLQLLDQQRDETLLSLQALRVDNVDFSLAANRLAISELILDALYSRVFIDENGLSNIRRALVPASSARADAESAAQESAAPAEAEGTAMAIELGRMKINDASSDFTDRSLPIVFDTKMHALNGEVSDFSSSSSAAMTVGLEGQVDEYGLVEITGSLNPLDITGQTEISLAFTNLDLPSMTPYVIKFAGREIAQGKADVALTYDIDDSALQASNSIVIRDIRLGSKVDYPGAMSLPLDLAIALLKNRDGVIDLNIPVTGNVNDPQFQLGPVIRQAIFNVLTNIVTAPFRLLGSLIGGDAEEIDDIRFRPGRSDLAPPEQEKLRKLLDALAQRPQLVLVIPAPFEIAADTLALQSAQVDERIDAQLAQDASEQQLSERRRAVLEALYEAAMLAPTLEELRIQFTTVPAAALQAGEDAPEPVFDGVAYSANLRDRLIAAESVAEPRLQELALARQAAVSEWMLANGEVAADRLRNAEVEAAPIEDNWLNAAFDVDVVQ